MRVVVDASVVVKWAVPEPYSQEARKLRNDHLLGRVKAVAPPCLWLEVASALREYVIRGVLPNDKALTAAELLYQTEVEIEEVDPRQVLATALKHGVTTYDAAYVYLAEKHNTLLYTADEKLLKHPKARHIKDY
ncbi:putative nucleic acid-binding protein, contains PIN domain [Pyrobaculum oguniense TE7]|uniref:Nucleic acid-binding protein, contains PIN domain n=1 Tax=Pyrobaculum oguniense (strain DSM 13380 / JCM 10595 / TE7) TaxID=698757 RepID=H6Q8H4_PYROT|nr:putative nucleic acid-binding protein, contains PIN domain [Pyrobaculum oguniense TE7]